jgi:aspartate/methionine/tyrosine aminotransferase
MVLQFASFIQKNGSSPGEICVISDSVNTLQPFLLERYFARYEFRAPYLLSASDCESLRLDEVLRLADPQTLEQWQTLSLGYTDSHGLPGLREEISAMYERTGTEEILVLAPEEGIFIAMLSLLDAGDEIIAVHPAYQSLHEIARSTGCFVRLWKLHRSGMGWAIDLEDLRNAITDRTRLIVINFPHNPTGHHITQQELDEIVAIARRHGLPIFSDEMYRLLEYSPVQRLPAVCDLYEQGISLAGMSKVFSLPGLRIGWLAARDAGMLAKWVQLKDYTTICSSAPGEVLSLMALRQKEKILERNLAIIQRNLQEAGEFFRGYPGEFEWLAPIAGPVAFPRWLGEGSAEAFATRMVEAHGVMVVPGSMFEMPGDHFRVGLGRRNFPEALQRLAGALQPNQTD